MFIDTKEVAIIEIQELNNLVEDMVLNLADDFDNIKSNGDEAVVESSSNFLFNINLFDEEWKSFKKRQRNFLIGQAQTIMYLITCINQGGININSRKFTIHPELFKFVSYVSKKGTE